MTTINLLRAILSYLLPGDDEKSWSAIAKETAQMLMRLIVFLALYAILCHAIRAGVADWVKAALVAVGVWGR